MTKNAFWAVTSCDYDRGHYNRSYAVWSLSRDFAF